MAHPLLPHLAAMPTFFSDADSRNTIERDKDRIWRRGPASLSDAELLSLLLSPPQKKSQAPATALATSLLTTIGNIAQISRASPRELELTLGPARAARIAAAFELGRRAVQLRSHRPSIGNADDIYRLAAPRLHGHAQELFLVIGLDIRNGLLDVVEVGRGTAIGVEVHPREVFRPLIRMAAAGAVLAHNHPSGDPTPSAEDLDLTRRMREIGQLLGIPVIDHVVIGQNGYRSILEWSGTDFDLASSDGHAADEQTSPGCRAGAKNTKQDRAPYTPRSSATTSPS